MRRQSLRNLFSTPFDVPLPPPLGTMLRWLAPFPAQAARLPRPALLWGDLKSAAPLKRILSNHPAWQVVGELHAASGADPSQESLFELVALARRLNTRDVILAPPACGYAAARKLIAQCARASLQGWVAGSRTDGITPEGLLQGADETEFRPAMISDFLQSGEEMPLSPDLIEQVRRRVVLVTGAGGSIGSELCRQIALCEPAAIVLLDQSEFGLYRTDAQLREQFPEAEWVPLLADIKDARRIDSILRRYRPALVLHAAAYKHVPLMEDENAWEGVRNNSLGTYVLANAAIQSGVTRFVLVSTDKAVNPANIMGASKRLAELMCQALQQTTSTTRLEIVRFGNVAGSAGSVIPRFAEQIAAGGPVTVTHPDIQRYFMTVSEAVGLVLQSVTLGRGGEVFVLDMGKPVRIMDLAQDMIRLAGKRDGEIRVELTGLRRGEKLLEELLGRHERRRRTSHPRIHIAEAGTVSPEWLPAALQWLNQPRYLDAAEVRRGLERWVPEYASALPADVVDPRHNRRAA